MGLLIRDAELAGARVDVRAGDDGRIAAIGPALGPHPGDDVVDAHGMALVGGLVNGHTHAAMTLFRGFGSDLQLQEWLQHWIWPAEAKLTAQDVYWGTRLACIEMLRSGTTHFFDMYWHPEAVARAAEETGIRATVGAPLFDNADASGLGALRDTAIESYEHLRGCGPLVTPSLTPHAIYTVSGPSLDWLAGFAAEHDLLVHIHLSETIREVDEWMTAHGVPPAIYLDERGLLGPRTLIAHGCVMNDHEYELVGERGATIVTNPVSNLKLANGRVFPYPTALHHGVHIGLGTDGASSNNSLDLLADLKVFALVQKHAAYDPTVLPAHEALEIAQGHRSPLLGGRPLAVGEPADLLLVRTDVPEMAPGSVVDDLVYAASGAVVDTAIVAGRVVMRGREVPGAAEVLAEVRARAARLTAGH